MQEYGGEQGLLKFDIRSGFGGKKGMGQQGGLFVLQTLILLSTTSQYICGCSAR
jgi:hypothetical protein